METNSWFNSIDSMRTHYAELERNNQLTKENLLIGTNELRAQSGDRPLTMAEYDQVHENVKNGIFLYQRYLPKTFSQRLRDALKRSWKVFVSTMRK